MCWVRCAQTHRATIPLLHELKSSGFTLFGTDLSGDYRPYTDCDFTKPTAFVMGCVLPASHTCPHQLNTPVTPGRGTHRRQPSGVQLAIS